jgi:DNA-binding response OmpR family regulator
VRHIMRSTLENFGFRVSTASDGAEAIALFRNAPALFDLAIVDMQMPGLDGGKTIVALRHLRPELPIVGRERPGHEREPGAGGGQNGVRHFLDKPFSVETLIRTVHAAMAKTAREPAGPPHLQERPGHDASPRCAFSRSCSWRATSSATCSARCSRASCRS